MKCNSFPAEVFDCVKIWTQNPSKSDNFINENQVFYVSIPVSSYLLDQKDSGKC